MSVKPKWGPLVLT